MLRVLTLSTLFPNAAEPNFVVFIEAIAKEFRADQIVVAPDEWRGMRLMDWLSCKTAVTLIHQHSGFIESETRRIDLKRMELGWLLYSEGFDFAGLDRLLKQLLLLAALPLLLAAMLAIKLEDGGRIFYTQTRVTRGGRDFPITKLRITRTDAEAEGAV